MPEPIADHNRDRICYHYLAPTDRRCGSPALKGEYYCYHRHIKQAAGNRISRKGKEALEEVVVPSCSFELPSQAANTPQDQPFNLSHPTNTSTLFQECDCPALRKTRHCPSPSFLRYLYVPHTRGQSKQLNKRRRRCLRNTSL